MKIDIKQTDYKVLSCKTLAILAASILLTACVVPQPNVHRIKTVSNYERNNAAKAATVYVYPAKGQSESQLDRDKYECNQWAIKQSGYDPSQLHTDAERVVVTSGSPPGANTAAGAITGAILGAAVSGPRQTGQGAIVGGIAGAMIGAATDAAREEKTERIQESLDQRNQQAQGTPYP